ncbi:hypothetical protein [Anaerotignum lactatifermentans]|uniref:hypothetical protein n=1 Tax=Anaerotignum lactatifermentans TaxID=160404 RepID=UPI00187346AE|nr:hypothetical protein [Anaerotignum lactatifermentans]MBE5075323.1 hypothetical protein [Anaerotignum lactatifermentans]
MFSYEDAPERGCPFFVSENVNGALFFCGIVEKGSVVRGRFSGMLIAAEIFAIAKKEMTG